MIKHRMGEYFFILQCLEQRIFKQLTSIILSILITPDACNEGFWTKTFNLRALLKNLELRDKAGDDVYVKRLRDLSRIPLLILDEWFACSPTKTELVFLHELIDSRYGRHTTIVCS